MEYFTEEYIVTMKNKVGINGSLAQTDRQYITAKHRPHSKFVLAGNFSKFRHASQSSSLTRMVLTNEVKNTERKSEWTGERINSLWAAPVRLRGALATEHTSFKFEILG